MLPTIPYCYQAHAPTSPPKVNVKNLKDDFYWNEHFQLMLEAPITSQKQAETYDYHHPNV